MEVQMSVDCNLCTNQPSIMRYVEGCEKLEQQVEASDELILVQQGLARCRGFVPGQPGDSLERKTCPAEVIAPVAHPVNPTILTTPEHVDAHTTVRITPPPPLDKRVTLSPIQ